MEKNKNIRIEKQREEKEVKER
jgi:hypothetical protein